MSTIKLPFKRFVRQVSAGQALSKYGYISIMEANGEALKSADWKEAKAATGSLTVNQLSKTDGKTDDSGQYTQLPTFTVYLDSKYDAFVQAGDAVSKMGTLCGYAGMVAYRFTLPTTNPGAITSFKVGIQRDRYLRAGVRVAAQLSDSAEPSGDWSVIRGEASGSIVSPSTAPGEGVTGVTSFGFLGQTYTPYLLAGRAALGEITFDAETFPALSTAANYTYLWVYISPEDFAGYWDMYNEEEARHYYIEGSAALVPASTDFTFSTAAVSPEPAVSFELVRGGVVPSFETGPTLSPVFQCTVTKNGDPIDYNSIKQLAALVAGSGGTVVGVKASPFHTHAQIAVIYGYGFKGTWTDLPGLVLMDVIHRELMYFNTTIGLAESMKQLIADGVQGVMDCLVTASNHIVPLFGQIGHQNPPLSVDGSVSKFATFADERFICGIQLTFDSANDYAITGGAPSTASSAQFSEEHLGCKSVRQNNGSMFVATDEGIVPTDQWIYRQSHPEFVAKHPAVPFVGTVRGLEYCDPTAVLPMQVESGAQWCFFVWGELTSVGGVPCSRCAFVTYHTNPADTTAYTYTVTVPDIDSDQSWPELGEAWSVAPQLSSATAANGGSAIAADYSSFMVCGCVDGGPRRFVTGVWYVTKYDETLVGGREIPHMGVVGLSSGYGGYFPATISTEDASVPITDAAAGLRALFGRFKADKFACVPDVTAQIGAAFCVSWKECQLKSSGVRIGSWQISCAALVVPFGCPAFGAKEVTFDWTGWTGARTTGTRFHVWLARGKYTVAPSELAYHGVWGSGPAAGLEYVGEIDPTGAATTATLAFGRPLDDEVATLVVTASVSIDQVNPSTSPVLPIGASTLTVNMADASLENADTAFLPDITLS